MIRLRARQAKYLPSIPSKQEDFFFLQSVQDETGTHQATYEKGKGASYYVWGGGEQSNRCVRLTTTSILRRNREYLELHVYIHSHNCLNGAHRNVFTTISLYSDVHSDIHSLHMEV